MAKHLKLTIKNTQIAEAVQLDSLKEKLAKKKSSAEENEPKSTAASKSKTVASAEKKGTAKRKTAPSVEEVSAPKEEPSPRVRARSKSVFSESSSSTQKTGSEASAVVEVTAPVEEPEKNLLTPNAAIKTPEELRKQLFAAEVEEVKEVKPKVVIPEISPDEVVEESTTTVEEAKPTTSKPQMAAPITPSTAPQSSVASSPSSPHRPTTSSAPKASAPVKQQEAPKHVSPRFQEQTQSVPKAPLSPSAYKTPERPFPQERKPYEKLGPTGRHVKDLIPPKKAIVEQKREDKKAPFKLSEPGRSKAGPASKDLAASSESGEDSKKRSSGVKEYRDIKPSRRPQEQKTFDARDRQGLRVEDDVRWRKKRVKSRTTQQEDAIVRPTSLKIRVPISIKDLAAEMKLKASQLMAKLFLQGLIVTLNDTLDDETTILLLGQEFGCEITIDQAEEKRIQITDKSIDEEISQIPADQLITRSPIVAFMGHVDHGKTSLIDAIRKSNRAASEAGAITQHIGAFRCHTSVGDITVLDTPGHEAFSAMRERGTIVTDIVVLVVAGDEGIRQQTIEAIKHALEANVTIVVAINKCDKPNFNAENIYRQLSEHNLLPEAWGGQTLTVNTSAITGEGIQSLLENLALQAEILELKASKTSRARGTVLESELHKGMGAVATVLVQNGTLRIGDALVFESHWGRIKTMQDEFGKNMVEAPPSTPAAITGLSGVPDAGEEFIVVKSEREAREIAEARRVKGVRQSMSVQKRPMTAESLLLQATPSVKKTLNVILRADVQGSLEALKNAMTKIESTKADLVVIAAGVGEVSESDIQMATTSKAVIFGFHTKIESHAEMLLKQLNVQVRLHDVIYHAIDDAKLLMRGLLEKIAEENDRGKAEVKAIFKSSQVGMIAGCGVIEGTVIRNGHVRVMRNGTLVGKSQISTLKRVKDDVREVTKGFECGISLHKFTDVQVGDILEVYEIRYIEQEL